MMKKLTKEIIQISKIPVGVCVLWNDFGSALAIAKETGAQFIRVPVFVDNVKNIFGEVKANPEAVISARKKLGTENVLIFADIQVKHAEMTDKDKKLEESARQAKEKEFPIIIGSGADSQNINKLFEIADAAIISTSLKEGESKSPEQERNLKPCTAKVDSNKVKEFMKIVKNG